MLLEAVELLLSIFADVDMLVLALLPVLLRISRRCSPDRLSAKDILIMSILW